ncbi:MAG TPA: signal peptide peptidase SppA [Candidatus Hydrogenedentes bacterium]|nr:signal peptide peptidase SppA [Candidatus Hydrogenedentota bacterium]
MAGDGKRRSCGCLLATAAGAGLAVVLAVVVGGYFLPVRETLLRWGPGVAVLDVFGEINDDRMVIDRIEELAGNPDVKALVVRVDSPGGVISVVEEIYTALERVSNDGMPVIASMGSTAASGGYFVCLAADTIFADRTSLTGSIGVMTEYTSAKELFDKIGVKFDTIASGEFKAMGSISEPLSDRQREHLQQVVNDFQDYFIEVVSKSRSLDPVQVRALADGRVFTGRQARELGLVDEIGGLDDAIDYAAKQAGLIGKPRIIRVRERAYGILDTLQQINDVVGARFGYKAFAPKYMMAR